MSKFEVCPNGNKLTPSSPKRLINESASIGESREFQYHLIIASNACPSIVFGILS